MSTTKRTKIIGEAVVLIGVSIISVAMWFIISRSVGERRPAPLIVGDAANQCAVTTKTETVNGTSLEPFIANGTAVTAAYNYYHCHRVQRGDIVLYQYAGDQNLLIKIVYGIPGDAFALQESSEGWNLLINSAVVKNQEGKPYLFDAQKAKMLGLYTSSYHNIIPPDAYLILGDNPAGTQDSSAFGLVGGGELVAKVIKY